MTSDLFDRSLWTRIERGRVGLESVFAWMALAQMLVCEARDDRDVPHF